MGIGLGMMGGIAGGMGTTVAGITTGALNSAVSPQGTSIFGGAAVTAANAPTTANPQEQAAEDNMAVFKQKVEKLKLLKEEGLLSGEEFEQGKKKLLESL
jgi:hypothetical protein